MTDGQFDTIAPLPLRDVTIRDSFWSPRLETIKETTLETVYEHLEETGRIDNFRVAAGEQDGEFQGRYYNDSDVYKWLEGACYLLALEDDPDLASRVEDVIDAIEAAQEDDGYLNTYFTLVEPEKKWTNLHAMHELYCAGHLFEAAVAHRRATGEERLLDVARRFADHIAETFGPDGMRGYPGHEEIELALVKLYRETGEDRYLDLARYFVDQRGTEPSRFEWEHEHEDEIGGFCYDHVDADGNYDGTYLQDHAPVREQDTVEGHAVRATYLYSGMADVAMETGDGELYATLERLWGNMTKKRMYVTGGIGSSPEGERFTRDYDLPNETSYAETCAALGSVLWNHRLLQLNPESRFADVIERTLYNGLLSGISLSGDRFFYDNPLEINGEEHALAERSEHRFDVQRQPWFETACCPTNVPRLLLSLGKYAYLAGNDELYVALYVGSEVETTIAGTDATVTQETEYPWDGTVEFEIEPDEAVEFGLKLRVPDWCNRYSVAVNGETVDAPVDSGFLVLDREWTDGDRVELDFEVAVDRQCAHPAVRENADRAALRRGPIVYCLEGVDHEGPLGDYVLPPELDVETAFADDLLDGVVRIESDALVGDRSEWTDRLYRSCSDAEPDDATVIAVPYYGWGHREPGEMRVWIRSQHFVGE